MKKDLRNRKEYRKAHYAKNRDRILKEEKAHRLTRLPELKDYQLKKLYGISLKEFENQLAKQHGCCAICKGQSSTKGRTFSVDHDHKTGKVRGILCGKCNVGLGSFKDSVDFLKEAIYYLTK